MQSDSQHASDGAYLVSRYFAVDGAGRLVFFPFRKTWTGWRGYVLADAECERTLREVSKRLIESAKYSRPLVLIVLLPYLFVFYSLVYIHPFLACLILLSAVQLVTFLEWAWRYWLVHRLVAGLERSDRRDLTLARRRLIVLAVGAALGCGIWLVLHLYDQRLSSLAADHQVIRYYPDISILLLGGSFFGAGALIVGAKSHVAVAELGPEKARLFAVASAIFAAAFAWFVVVRFINPTPAIVIDDDAIFCPRPIRWVDIARVDLAQRYLEKDARFTIRNAAVTGGGRGNQVHCEISWLTEDYRRVYSDIHIHWLLLNPGAATSDTTR